jgi:hypothetical protein
VIVMCNKNFDLNLKLKLQLRSMLKYSSPHAPLHESQVEVHCLFHQGRVVHDSAQVCASRAWFAPNMI